MPRFRTAALLVASLLLAAPALAERPEHFQGKPAKSLVEALANLAEYNQKLHALLARDQLSAEDLQAVHQLTYTLENALERLDDEVDRLEDLLEEVHLASERLDAATVKKQGAAFLWHSAPLTR